jgi:hypothetical protein
MISEAKQNLQDTLKKAQVSAIERERLIEEHRATMKNILDLAEEQFQIALERERQERRWAAGQTLDQEWSESMIKEQQGILDTMERERNKKVVQFFFASQPTAGASGSRTYGLPVERAIRISQEPTEGEQQANYFSRLANREAYDVHILAGDTSKACARLTSGRTRPHKPLSTYTTDRDFERSKPSPAIDERKDIPRSARSATDIAKSIKPETHQHKVSLSARQIPQFWIPSITPEEDAQISRTFRGSTARTTSSHRASPMLNIPLSTEPHGLVERERHRILAVEQEWSNFDRAWDRAKATSYTNVDARVSAPSTPQRLEAPFPPPSVSHGPGSTIRHSRSSEDSRPRASPPSASRPIATKKSFTFDDGGFQSSPSPTKGWNGPSCTPQIPDGGSVPQSWQSSNLRTRLLSQDMLLGNSSADGGYHPRPVHTHNDVYNGEYNEDLDDADWREYDERRNSKRGDSFRKREEEVARRELELRRRQEEARREEEVKQKEFELRRKEEAQRRQEEAERKEEEAQPKELEIRREEEEEEEEEERRREEDEIKLMEIIVKRKQEVRKHAEYFRRQELAKRSDKEARRAEQDILRKSEEAKRKEDEDRRMEDEIRCKEEEEGARREEREVRKKSSQELSAVASGSPQDLTDQLQGRSNYPIASGGFGDIWKCDLVKLNEIVQVWSACGTPYRDAEHDTTRWR